MEIPFEIHASAGRVVAGIWKHIVVAIFSLRAKIISPISKRGPVSKYSFPDKMKLCGPRQLSKVSIGRRTKGNLILIPSLAVKNTAVASVKKSIRGESSYFIPGFFDKDIDFNILSPIFAKYRLRIVPVFAD